MKRPHFSPQEGALRRRLVLSSILLTAAILLLILSAVLIFSSRFSASEPPEEPASFCYELSVYQDRLAVYTSGQPTPTQILDIPLAGLPEADQELLERGITLHSEEELRRAIEDYT